MPRYVSFRFDDGFITGARTAAACLAPDYGTFFLIADLVVHGATDHPEPLFRGRDFGSIPEWRELAAAGQDIQLHGCTHTSMKELSADEQQVEIAASLNLAREIHDGPYVFCHPFNHQVDLDFAELGLSAAGFRTGTSDKDILFNRLDDIDLFALVSWAVRERHFDTVVEELKRLPEESWAILAFHSFEGEGHEPWSASAFRQLVSACRELELTIVTLSDMVKTYNLPPVSRTLSLRRPIPKNVSG